MRFLQSAEIFFMSRPVLQTVETNLKSSSGVSRVTWGDEMNEMVQYKNESLKGTRNIGYKYREQLKWN